MDRFLIKIDENTGEKYSVINPEYNKHVRKEKYELFLKQSGIPEFYHNIEFDDYKGNHESEEFRKIKYYAEHCHEEEFKYASLYLFGSNSTQKTALSCNVLKTAMKNGLRAKFILAGELINKLMKLQTYNFDEKICNQIEELKTCDILCIDDVGDVKKSPQWENNSLITAEWDNFFRDILANGVKVVLTSNMGIEIFKQTFSDSLYELLDRNIYTIQLYESVKTIRKLKIESLFENVNY